MADGAGRGKAERQVRFRLNGAASRAPEGTTIWAAAQAAGVDIPHLCHRPAPGYRPDGNCRACLVDVAGERRPVASCIRAITDGMEIDTEGARARRARALVLELLLADQPHGLRDPASDLARSIEAAGVAASRFPARPAREVPSPDRSHPAMAVALDACIQCGLCVRACREVQVNDVIGTAGRGASARIVFDQDDPMGESSCVGCGECVQACPTGALLPVAVLDTERRADPAWQDEGAVESVCPYCGVGCAVAISVRDGGILAVEGALGPANEGRLCVKGRFGLDYITHPERLTRPLVRRRDAPPKGTPVDPSDPGRTFRAVSWDEALDRAAAGLAALREADPETVAGLGSAKGSNEEAYLFQKLIRQGFGHNHVDHCTRLCHASSVAALLEGLGSGAVTAGFREVANADVALVIGANPTENHPVAATYLKQFARAGGTLIVADPRRQALARHAAHALTFRPGTDVAMLNAIMHAIIDEGLQDRAYIDRCTEGWEAFAHHLAAFPPERMARLCGVSAERLRAVARAFAAGRAGMIFWGMGVSQHVHGTDNARCLIALALMTGNVGRPGTGLHPLRGQNNVQGASDAGLIPMFLPGYAPVEDTAARARFSRLWGAPLSARPGLTVTEMMDAARAGSVRGMYIMGENPAMSDPDAAHARAALADLDHLVVQDIFLTETAQLADVVLPAAAWPEKLGTVTNTNRTVQMGRPAAAPPGEARPDWRILTDMAQRLGLGWSHDGPGSVFAEMAQTMDALDTITWERLAEGAVTYPSQGREDPGRSVVFSDGFPRPGGRARFVPAQIVPPDEPPDADFPFVLITGRQLEHWHTGSMTRRTDVLDALEPGPTCAMHPRMLRTLDLRAGGMVEVASRRGCVRLAARADRSVSEGCVFLPFAYAEAAANLLTNPALDPFGKIPEYKYCAVRVTAAE